MEAIIALLALALSGLTTRYAAAIASGWEGQILANEIVLSWAGLASSLVSNPLFLFLVFRWIWRTSVWAMLMWHIARLPLQPTPLHPDRSAGLGFLSIYPTIFTGFVFALSCVIVTSFLKEMGAVEHARETVWLAIGTWLSLMVVVFIGPLLVFTRPLYAVRERALIEYGRLASQHHLAFDRKWIGESRSGDELLGSGDLASGSDLNSMVGAIREIRFVPIDMISVGQLLMAAGISMLVVVAHEVPVTQLLGWIVSAIL